MGDANEQRATSSESCAYRPRLVVTGGEAQIAEIGRSLIVAPGSLAEGSYAVAHLRTRTAEVGHMAVPSR